MADTLAELEKLIASLDPKQKRQMDQLMAAELAAPFRPNPGPQLQAFLSKADLLLYGGAAGGGKTALMCGKATMHHNRGLIVRRQAVELDGIVEEFQSTYRKFGKYVAGSRNEWRSHDKKSVVRLGGMRDPDSWRDYAGRARDFIGFDEAGEFTREQVFSLEAWCRSTDPDQHCQVMLASNPPRGGEGEWMIEEFAPWLDDLFPNPAKYGELRWAIRVASRTEWVDGPGIYVRDGEEYTAKSRTFIPARLDDNPYLRDTGYRATLQSLPEPLRSQLLHGDFAAGREDHEYQVIPSAWVQAAQERWKAAPKKQRRMHALAVDPSGEGPDKTTLASLHAENWFAPVAELDLPSGATGQMGAAQVLIHRRNNCDVSIDMTGGWGTTLSEALWNDHRVQAHPWVFSEASGGWTRDGQLAFANVRSELWWSFREALDPEKHENIMLPPDKRLAAQLTAPRWKMRGGRIYIESKDEIRKRLGASTDDADAVLMAWGRRHMVTFQVMEERHELTDAAEMGDPFEGIL